MRGRNCLHSNEGERGGEGGREGKGLTHSCEEDLEVTVMGSYSHIEFFALKWILIID